MKTAHLIGIGMTPWRFTIFFIVVATTILPTVLHAQEGEEVVLIDCSLCADPTHTPQDASSVFVAGSNTYTCQTAFELGVLQLPVENCTFWQSRGDTICQCAESAPEPNDCTLCEDGSSLPQPLLEGIPGRACAQLQVDARRDSVEMCLVYQQTFGTYCGCNNSVIETNDTSNENGSGVCRLCNGTILLEDPTKLVPLLSSGSNNVTGEISCVELEFEANLPDSDECNEYQLLYQDACCLQVTNPPESEDDDGDGGAGRFADTTWMGCLLITLFLSWSRITL